MKWEYSIVSAAGVMYGRGLSTFSRNGVVNSPQVDAAQWGAITITTLNKLGQEGWELVGVTSDDTQKMYFLKRPCT